MTQSQRMVMPPGDLFATLSARAGGSPPAGGSFASSTGGSGHGPRRRLRFARRSLAALAGLGAVGLLGISMVLGAIQGLGTYPMNLDGQIGGYHINTNAPFRWGDLFDVASGKVTGPNNSLGIDKPVTSVFTADYFLPDYTYYATSVKDINDISAWECGSISNPTAKDELLNAYAALFNPTQGPKAGHSILYVASERPVNNGDSFAGFWIFQKGVNCDSSPSGNTVTFSGQHTVGDLLVLSNYVLGGSEPNFQVYEWNPATTQATNPLQLLDVGGSCATAQPGDDACASVNTASQTPPWFNNFNTKTKTASTVALANNEFLEIGIDLTDLLNNGSTTTPLPCFSRFQAESRSSQQTTAQLKDFANGAFNECKSQTVTQPSNSAGTAQSAVEVGHAIYDKATVTGTSAGGIGPNPTGTVTFSVCSPTSTTFPTNCTSGGTLVGTGTLNGTTNPATAMSPAFTPTKPGQYCFRADYAGDSNYPASSDGSATECFNVVDAYVTLTPGKAANQIGQTHTLTATVKINDGTGTTANYVNAPDNTTVNLSLVAGSVGSFSKSSTVTSTTCSTTNGTCTANLYSSSPGLSTVNAAISITVKGVALSRTTGDGVSSDSANAVKTWVNAKIVLSPLQAANQVGSPHVITATLYFDYGDGKGFVAAPDGQTINLSVTAGPGTLTAASCLTGAAGTGTGACTDTLNSSTTGVSTVHATWSGSISTSNGSASATAATGTSPSSNDAVKTWVNAKIVLSPLTATNILGTTHTITATLSFDYGDGKGWTLAPDGETINLSIASGPGSFSSSSAVSTTTCTTGTPTSGSGACSVNLYNSTTTGTTVVHATWSGTISTSNGNASASAATGSGASSSDAQKTWVSGTIKVTKNIVFGPFTTSATVCFTLTQTSPGTMTPNKQCYTFTSPTTSHVFEWDGLTAGTYSVSETSVTAPYTVVQPEPIASNIVLSNTTTSVTLDPVTDPLPQGHFKILKQLNGQTYTGGSGTFTFQVSSCGGDATCASPVFVENVTIDGTVNPLTVGPLNEGYYQVTEINIPVGFSVTSTNPQIVQVFAGDTCSATADPGITCPASLPVTLTFNNQPTTFGQITPTGTTCAQFAGQTSTTLTTVTYNTSGSTISNDQPGVFFYYDKLVAPGGAFTITVNQTNSAGTNYLFHVLNDSTSQMTLYDANCNVIGSVTENASNPAAVTFAVPSSTNGQVFFLGVKYSPKSVVGLPVPSPLPSPWLYTYSTKVNGTLMPGSTQSLTFAHT